MSSAYSLQRLRNGQYAVFAAAYGETMHPGAGPQAEAEGVHVGQLKLRERQRAQTGELVVWDVGLGAAANAVAVLRATAGGTGPLRLISFDRTLSPLRFALQHTAALGYLERYAEQAQALARHRFVEFSEGGRIVRWEVRLGDFPALLAQATAANLAQPQAILFDPFSPARNPAMWTLPLFERLFRQLDPHQPCELTTYSRSTLIRVALLVAGFFVGRGRASVAKEETTVAATRLALLDDPLTRAWLRRVRRSSSAEPLFRDVYQAAPLTPATWERLAAHPQFAE